MIDGEVLSEFLSALVRGFGLFATAHLVLMVGDFGLNFLWIGDIPKDLGIVFICTDEQ